MRRSDKEQSKTDKPVTSRRLPKLESLLRSEVGGIMERELELPSGTLLTITEVDVLPDLSQARIGVSVVPTDRSEQVFKILTVSAFKLQRLVNQRLKLYRVPRLNFYLDPSLEQAGRIGHLLDNLKIE